MKIKSRRGSLIDTSKLPVVTSDRIMQNGGVYHPYGLLSEQIFGPVKDRSCQCGLYTGYVYKGKRCPECGVLCDSSNLRYTTFARIILNIPAIHPYNRKILKTQICRDFPNLLEPIQSDYVSSNPLYLAYIKNKWKIVNTYDDTCLPITITGIFSLYIAIRFGYEVFGDPVLEKVLDESFMKDVLVVPPQARHVLKDETGSLILGTLNKLYTQLISTNNFIGRELEALDVTSEQLVQQYLKAIKQLCNNSTGHPDPFYDEELVEHDRFFSKIQYFIDQIYNEISGLLSGKEGLIRSQFISRTIDFSARAVITTNPTLKAYEINISKKIFLKLYMIEFLYWLNHNGYIKNQASLLKCIQDTEYVNNYAEHFENFIEYFFKPGNVDDINKLVLFNRQPTLWRHGLCCVKIKGVIDENVIQMSPLLLEQFNADHDGDRMAIYKLHDINSLKELEVNSYNLNIVKYEHNDSMLHRVRLEAVYGLNVIFTENEHIDYSLPTLKIDKLQTLDIYHSDYNQPIEFNGKIYSYGIGLLNKWCGFNTIVINKRISNSKLSEILYETSKSNEEYHTRLRNVNLKLYWFVITHSKYALTFPMEPIMYAYHPIKDLFKKLPKNPIIGYAVHKGLVDRLYNEAKSLGTRVSLLLGTKLNKTQLARSIASIGYIADDHNIVQHEPITSNILTGLDEDDFFTSSFGTRKGVVDKQKITPQSGYLERSMVMNLSTVDIDKEDCGTPFYFEIKILSEQHKKLLYNKWFFDETDNSLKLFNEETSAKFNIGDTIKFRSPITCINPDYRICHKCFGNYKLTSPFVGILAGQYVSERLTQLSMRSFHTSGSCSIEIDPKIVNYIEKHLIDIEYTEDSEHVMLVFNNKIPYDIISKFSKLEGYQGHDWNRIIFSNDISYYEIINPDVGKTVKTMAKILNTERVPRPIEESYKIFMTNIMNVGNIYSSFIEVVLCNLYECESGRIYRYELKHHLETGDPISEIAYKYNIKKLFKKISKVLGLLYEPNKSTIQAISSLDKLSYEAKGIYEQLWLGLF